MAVKQIVGSLVLATSALWNLTGCDSSGSAGGNRPSMNEMARAMNDQENTKQQQEQAAAAEQPQPAAEPPAEPARQKAGREGVGEGGYYTAIVGARRHVLNKVEGLAWLQGVQHFQAEHGRLPKDHEEFMTRIVQPLGIDLGYKEENQEFLYDPSEGQWGTLYVVEKIDEPAQG